MPSPALGAFGKMMFEKKMREKNMNKDPMGKFIMPTQQERLEEMMRVHKDALPGEGFKRFGTSQMIMDPKLRDMVRDGTVNLEKGIGAGFDNSALMQDPKFRQMDTMNQGMTVSEPYEEANKQAFSKNNPMNAISQETTVGDRVDEFLERMGRMGGGTADFMTGGLTDFDRRGDSPNAKFGKRVLGGLTDFMTGGLTDFDKRSR